MRSLSVRPGTGQHDVELFAGPCQCYIEEVQIVHMRHDVFAVVVGSEVGVFHRLFIVYGELSDGSRRGVLFRPRPHDGTGLGRQGPIAVGNDDGLVAEPFGAVDGVDGDGVSPGGIGMDLVLPFSVHHDRKRGMSATFDFVKTIICSWRACR